MYGLRAVVSDFLWGTECKRRNGKHVLALTKLVRKLRYFRKLPPAFVEDLVKVIRPAELPVLSSHTNYTCKNG